MITIINKKTTIDEVIDIYSDVQKHFTKILKLTKTDYENLNENKDTRIVSLKLIIESVQTNIILLHSVKENFGELKLWNNHQFETIDQRNAFINDRLYFIMGDLRESLFINTFLRFESFMKIIALSLGINGERINTVCKSVIEKLNLNPDYNNLIDLFTYSRNTIHSEGFHTRDNIIIVYKENSFEFKKNEPLLFYNLDFLAFMIIEIGNLMANIINTEEIVVKDVLEHTYSNISFEYE